MISLYIRALPGPPRIEESASPSHPPTMFAISNPGLQQDPQGRQSDFPDDPEYQQGPAFNPDEPNHFPNPRPSVGGYRRRSSAGPAGSDGGSSHEDQFKIHLPPDVNDNNIAIEDGRKTYSRQRLELAQLQEQQTLEQREQHQQIQRQLTKRFGSQHPQLHPHPDYQRQVSGQPNPHPGYQRQVSEHSNGHIPNGNAGVQRNPNKTGGKYGDRGGGDILRRGLNHQKPRPVSMPPQESRNDANLKIRLPPAEY